MTLPSPATAAHDAGERRDAARALLAVPMLSNSGHPDELAMVRRHATPLKSMFATVLGYHLVVESSFARLVKAPLSTDTPTRPARRRSGSSEFTPRTYAYLALVCAALLAPDAGEQVLMSALVEQLRADAATAGITLDDTYAESRHLVAAIQLLATWGVVAETDGTIAGWSERRDEALLTVNRALLPHLLTRPLTRLTAPGQLWLDPGDMPEQPRRSLRRKLVENPLVRREDLTDAERDALSRERHELDRVLQESFGLILEVRSEGALAYDPDGELTDITFPGSGPGAVRQAALLLLDALIDAYRPRAGADVDVGGRRIPGVLAGWEVVDEKIADLAHQNTRPWGAETVGDLPRLRAGVVALLAGMGLAVATDDGLVLHPAVARYRPDPQRSAAKTRGRRRMGAGHGQPADDLFTQDHRETS
jgi:uncharacterized protein (TIGR02678 family)